MYRENLAIKYLSLSIIFRDELQNHILQKTKLRNIYFSHVYKKHCDMVFFNSYLILNDNSLLIFLRRLQLFQVCYFANFD
jgi:hypothetical protein